jgi:hypothetical protein
MRRLLLLITLLLSLVAHIFVSHRIWDIRASARQSGEASYVLPSRFSRILALGYHGLLSDYQFLKALTFYGERQMQQKPLSEDDWHYLATSLEVVTELDPYFFDPYIFAEGAMAWEGRIAEANKLLEKGRRHRDFDWRIPYFIGFNYFYFLQDFEKGGEYIMEAARLPGSPRFLPTLAARLTYYGGKSETAILFLKGMLAETEDPSFRTSLEKRLIALERAADLEKMIVRFKNDQGRPPDRLGELVDGGYIDVLPEDPYGGQWIILESGRVFSTSKFTTKPEKR